MPKATLPFTLCPLFFSLLPFHFGISCWSELGKIFKRLKDVANQWSNVLSVWVSSLAVWCKCWYFWHEHTVSIACLLLSLCSPRQELSWCAGIAGGMQENTEPLCVVFDYWFFFFFLEVECAFTSLWRWLLPSPVDQPVGDWLVHSWPVSKCLKGHIWVDALQRSFPAVWLIAFKSWSSKVETHGWNDAGMNCLSHRWEGLWYPRKPWWGCEASSAFSSLETNTDSGEEQGLSGAPLRWVERQLFLCRSKPDLSRADGESGPGIGAAWQCDSSYLQLAFGKMSFCLRAT